jgi:hypothetical protein
VPDLHPVISVVSGFRAGRSCIARRLLLCLSVLWLSLGPQLSLAGEFQLTPSLSLREEYNDNIFFDTQNAESDFITRITPGLELTDKTERLDARVRAELPIFWYAHDTELDDVDQHYSGNLVYLLTDRLSTSLNAGYSRTSQPDRDILETGLVIGTAIRHQYYGGVSGEYSLSEISKVGLAYDYLSDVYLGPGYTDVQSHNAYLVFARDLSKTIVNTQGRFTLGFSLFDFSGSRVENYTAMVGAVRKVTELYSLSADVGGRYTLSALLNEGSEGSTGVVGRAALSYNGEKTTGSLTFFQDIALSGGQDGVVQRTALVFDVGKRFTYDMWGHLTAGWYLNSSEGTELAFQNIDEETWLISPWIRYNFTRNLSLDASYSFTRVKYKTNATEANRNLVFLRLVYRYPLFE